MVINIKLKDKYSSINTARKESISCSSQAFLNCVESPVSVHLLLPFTSLLYPDISQTGKIMVATHFHKWSTANLDLRPYGLRI
jgi:hypothetical protein